MLNDDIRRRRRKLRLSQIELAKLTGIPQPVLSRYETSARTPSILHLQAIAVALGCELVIELRPIFGFESPT